ncbi:MAG: hypothetical protein HY905_01570 [Deltaproteobacteria bacterium]|nr:hypothetical protein [Deltaproteobacteria bacterium]
MPNLAPQLRIEGPQVSPRRLTPDANLFADNARLGATLLARPGRVGVALGDRIFLWEAACTVSVVDSQGLETRRFERRRRLELPAEPAGLAKTDLQLIWNGRAQDGKAVPPGLYSVRFTATLQAVNVRTGAVVPVARGAASGGTIEVTTQWDNRETAWVQLRALEQKIGLKPKFADWDSEVKYELASVDDMDALAAAAVQAQGRNLAAEFAAALAAVRADPEIPVKPTPAQVAAWQALFVGSHGRVEVRWAASGVPREITGLDAGLATGNPQTVASHFLSAFAPSLSALYRRGPLDEIVFERVVERAGDPMAVVKYVHRVSGQAEKTGFDVPGDVLAVQVRTAGMPGKSGRVEAVTARWNPLGRMPGPVLPDEVLHAIAKSASDLDLPQPVRATLPWVAFPKPGDQRLFVDAFVADFSADEARVVRLDAETGEVVGIRDGYPKARVSVPAGPLAPDDGLFEHYDCEIGLPYATVRRSPAGGDSTTTTATGYYDLSGDWGTVGLDGRYAKELVLYDMPGDADGTCAGFTYRQPVTERIALGDETTIPIPHSRAGQQTFPDQDFGMATLYAHTNYQAELWRWSGLHDQDPVYLWVEWAPMGYAHTCTLDTDCDGCDLTTGTCRASEFHTCTADADCVTIIEMSEKICDPRYESGLCRPGNNVTPAAWRRAGTDRLTERCGADASLPYPFIYFNTRLFDCELPATGCPTDQLGIFPRSAVLDTHPHAEVQVVGQLAHEYTHHLLEVTETQFHASTARWGRPGRLAGLLSEALPDAVFGQFYGDTQLWENRTWDFVDFLGHRFGGDPTSTSPMCGGPERDDPSDDFSCPEGVPGDGNGDTVVAPGEMVATPTCAPVGDANVDSRCLEWDPDPAHHTTCAAGGVTPGVWCSPGTRAAYRAVDIHHNGTWFKAAMARLGYTAGRRRAAGAYGGLIGSGIDDLTTVSRGTNSVYQITADPPGGSTSPMGWYAAETWKAFSAGIRNDDDPAVNPEALDEETNLTFHGDLMQGREQAVGPFRVMHVGQLEEWPGNVAVAGKLDRHSDRDVFTTWLEFGKDYDLVLEPNGIMMKLSVFEDRSRGEGETDPTGTQVLAVPDGDSGVVTYTLPGDGYYSFRVSGLLYGPSCRPDGCPYRLFISKGTDCVDDPRYDCRDDYPDERVRAVPLPQSAQDVPGTLLNRSIRDRDQFKFYLMATRTATVRLRAAASHSDYAATVISPDGHATSIDTFRCRSFGDCAFEADVAAPTSGRGGWWNIELERTGGTPEPLDYELSIASAATLPCSNPFPADAADPCLVPPRGAVAGTIRVPFDTDTLWFEGERDHVYVIAVDGDVTASLHAPTFYSAPGVGARPGITPANRPLFRHSEDWPGQISIVAPLDGIYGILVAPEGDRTFWNYSVRIFGSHWTDPDYPSIVEWAGPTAGCGLP